MLLAPGEFMTTMPRAVAVVDVTLSTPVPARAIARSFGAAAMMSGVTLVATADDERVGVGEIGFQLVGRAAGLGVDAPAFGAEELESGSREVVGNYDVHVAGVSGECREPDIMHRFRSDPEARAEPRPVHHSWCNPHNSSGLRADTRCSHGVFHKVFHRLMWMQAAHGKAN